MAGLFVGSQAGPFVRYDDNGNIVEIDGYPDASNGLADIQIAEVMVGDGNLIVTSDMDFPHVMFIDATTGVLLAHDVGSNSSPLFENYGYPVFVGNEVWLFFRSTDNFIRRFTRSGTRIADVAAPFSAAGTYGGCLRAISPDNGATIYLLGESNNSHLAPDGSQFIYDQYLLRWVPATSTLTEIANLTPVIQGAYSSAAGDVRSWAVHQGEIVVSTYNTGYDPHPRFHSHAAIVRVDPSSGTQIARYEIGDETLSGAVATWYPRVWPKTQLHDIETSLWAVTSDGVHIWTGDIFSPGAEIWRIDPSTGAILLWNQQVVDYSNSPNLVPTSPTDPNNLNNFNSSTGPGSLLAPAPAFTATFPQVRIWPTAAPNLAGAIGDISAYFSPGRS